MIFCLCLVTPVSLEMQYIIYTVQSSRHAGQKQQQWLYVAIKEL